MVDNKALDVTKAWESKKLAHNRPLLCCAISPCGKFVVAGAQDEHLLRWNLSDHSKTELAGHESWVQAVAFHPNQQHLLSGDLHGTLRMWEYVADKPQPIWTRVEAHRTWVLAAAATPDGKHWVTSGTDGVIRLWNAADGQPAGELLGHETDIYALAMHPDGKHLVSGDLMGRIFVWNLETRTRERTLDAALLHTRKEDFLADVGGVRSLAFNADGTWLAAGGMTDAESNTFCPGKPAVLVFEYATGKLNRTLRTKEKSDGPIKGLCFLGDGTLAVQGEHLNAGSSLEFFAAEGDQPKHVMKRESGYAVCLHPNGLELAIAGFVNHGRGGNGRHAKPEEYVTHHGALVMLSLHARPTTT